MLKKILSCPQLRNIEIDSPQCTEIHKSLIKDKGFLRQIYLEWYEQIAARISENQGAVLEIGTGGGFLQDLIPELITSEVFYSTNSRLTLNGNSLPFKNNSLKNIILIDVFHHIPEPRPFLSEACRCLQEEGSLIMLEPWVTTWSKFIYANLHHEPFLPNATNWSFPPTGPLSGANGAVPWIIFQRDRTIFEKDFPELKIADIQLTMPFRYLLSGGVSMRSLMPGWSFPFWRGLEKLLHPFMNSLAMFAYIEIRKRS